MLRAAGIAKKGTKISPKRKIQKDEQATNTVLGKIYRLKSTEGGGGGCVRGGCPRLGTSYWRKYAPVRVRLLAIKNQRCQLRKKRPVQSGMKLGEKN